MFSFFLFWSCFVVIIITVALPPSLLQFHWEIDESKTGIYSSILYQDKKYHANRAEGTKYALVESLTHRAFRISTRNHFWKPQWAMPWNTETTIIFCCDIRLNCLLWRNATRLYHIFHQNSLHFFTLFYLSVLKYILKCITLGQNAMNEYRNGKTFFS